MKAVQAKPAARNDEIDCGKYKAAPRKPAPAVIKAIDGNENGRETEGEGVLN